MDAHWKAHHESEIPYSEFKKGLCEVHSSAGAVAFSPVENPAPHANSLNDNYNKALAQRSSHVENVLIHALIAKVAQELWQRDPWLDFQVFKTDVDDSGFDLVLGCKGMMRFIQIKQTHLQGKAAKYSMRLDFTRMMGACAIVVVFDGNALEIDHFLFYGGLPGESMPDISGNQPSLSPGRRSADGTRKIRANYRDVSRSVFQGPLGIAGLVNLLFPVVQH